MREPASRQLCRFGRALAALSLLFWFAAQTAAERLPLRYFSVADGLSGNLINRIVCDSRGFLWFCTTEGLSRFDGYNFVTYGKEHGLINQRVTDLLETGNGARWVATRQGIYRFHTAAFDARAQSLQQSARPPLFTHYAVNSEDRAANNVQFLYEDRRGRVWVATINGLYQLQETGDAGGSVQFARIELKPRWQPSALMHVEGIVEDHDGTLWIGTSWGLFLLFADGSTLHYSIQPQGSIDPVRPQVVDDAGRVWMGHMTAGLIVAVPGGLSTFARQQTASQGAPLPLLTAASRVSPSADGVIDLPTTPGAVRQYTTAHGLQDQNVWTLFRDSDGVIWLGTIRGGVTRFKDRRLQTFTQAQGLKEQGVRAIAEDRDGNLWIGTESSGVMRLARGGFLSYDEADGLGHNRINAISETADGALYVMSGFGSTAISRFDGQRFETLRPNYPPAIRYFGWGWGQIHLQDRAGDWWLATGDGVVRVGGARDFTDLSRLPAKAVYTIKDGLPGNNIFRLYEDRRGDIWMSITFPPASALARWNRATETIESFAHLAELAAFETVSAYCEDAFGNLWLGGAGGGLARYAGGRFQFFPQYRELAGVFIRNLFVDSRNRLWVGTLGNGAARLDVAPSADAGDAAPTPVNYTTASGLSSNQIWGFTEDAQGRIYIATSRGIDRLTVESGQLRHYSTADGLCGTLIHAVRRDRQGALWFGTTTGLSRLMPEEDRAQPMLPTLLTGVRVEGEALALSELGESNLAGLEFAPHQQQLQIDFVSLNFAPGNLIRHQYRLEGADDDWSAPTTERTVNYPNLPPGSYRFLVRAVGIDGTALSEPASLSFVILAPIWQRWWFLTLLALALAALGYAAYRYRVEQLLALERVRTRIATDLHDDIGSSLSQIAILSEVAQQESGNVSQRVREPLAVIAATSREMVDSMSDIVWAINPQKDHLSDLTQRLRRFASDTLAARNIEFTFRTPTQESDIKLGADLRRQVFLVFKESLNNLVRHADCTEAEIDFAIRDGWLLLTVSDNGKGLCQTEAQGNGLSNMRRRAEALGGRFQLLSANGNGGITVQLQVPLQRRRGWRRR